jgi:hypothetical protein
MEVNMNIYLIASNNGGEHIITDAHRKNVKKRNKWKKGALLTTDPKYMMDPNCIPLTKDNFFVSDNFMEAMTNETNLLITGRWPMITIDFNLFSAKQEAMLIETVSTHKYKSGTTTTSITSTPIKIDEKWLPRGIASILDIVCQKDHLEDNLSIHDE